MLPNAGVGVFEKLCTQMASNNVDDIRLCNAHSWQATMLMTLDSAQHWQSTLLRRHSATRRHATQAKTLCTKKASNVVDDIRLCTKVASNLQPRHSAILCKAMHRDQRQEGRATQSSKPEARVSDSQIFVKWINPNGSCGLKNILLINSRFQTAEKSRTIVRN